MIKKILFGEPTIWNPKGKINGFNNVFTGTFSNQKMGVPNGVMVNKWDIINGNSSHWLWDYPESVLWIKKDGSYGVDRVITVTQIKGYKDIVFAISGVGISDFNPKAEGFCKFTRKNVVSGLIETKDFSDVLRRTTHSVFGFKDDVFFASIMYGHASEIKAECELMGLTHVIMGDGGSWSTCIVGDYRLNPNHIQYSAVQITKVVDKSVESVDKWKYFKYSEFANSQDGGANQTSHELIDKMDQLRTLVGRSIRITSGYRTIEFNKKAGGSPNSYHTHGLACDFRFNFSGYTLTSLTAILKYLGFKNIGFYWDYGRIGGKLNRIHADIGTPKNNSDFRVMHWNSNGKYIKG